MNDSEGNLVGKGVGPDQKWIIRSRAFAAMWLPALALVLRNAGLGEDVFGQLEMVVEALLVASGGVMWLWHHFRPDGARKTLAPVKFELSGIASALILSLALASSPTLTGCTTMRSLVTGAEATPAESPASKWVLAVAGFETAQVAAKEYLKSGRASPETAKALAAASAIGTELIRSSGGVIMSPTAATIALEIIGALKEITAEILDLVGEGRGNVPGTR